MAAKIFYRERMKVKAGAKSPRYRVVGVAGADLKIYGSHLRKKELEQIAKEVGADLVLLKRDKKSKSK